MMTLLWRKLIVTCFLLSSNCIFLIYIKAFNSKTINSLTKYFKFSRQDDAMIIILIIASPRSWQEFC